ncbi:MAG TPA: glycosyltransferase [Vicinamibacterales bacterium]|nr:glycosyltransferase [Vicinamibacterales bacterium]
MNILYLLPAVSHPTMRGEPRHFNFLRSLARRHDVTVLALTRLPVTADALSDLRQSAKNVFIMHTELPAGEAENDRASAGVRAWRQRYAKRRRVGDALGLMRSQLRQLVQSERFDVALVYGVELEPVLDELRGVPIVADLCDAQSVRIGHSLRFANPVEGAWRLVSWWRTRRAERSIASRAQNVTFISGRDLAAVPVPADRARIVPNGVDAAYWSRSEPLAAAPSLIFTGVMDYGPNADAGTYLTTEILPRVRLAVPDARLTIAGRNPSATLRSAAGTGAVTVTGAVADLRPFLDEAAVFVAPLRFASGMQNKILEAMAMQLPVVTSTVAADGLRIAGAGAPPILVADEADVFAATVVGLLRDAERRRTLGIEARAYVKRHFDWERSASQLEACCLAAATSPDLAPTPNDLAVPPLPAVKEPTDVGKAQIRGSSLLLSGRMIALGVALLAQVLLIRSLTPADFGRWMYALSVVTVLKSVAGLGIDRSIARFVAVYHERGDRARLLGVMVLTIGAVLGVGGVLIGVLYAMPDQVMRLTQNQSEPLRLLFILIFLVPLEALDSLLLAVFASFGNARAIFFRRHIVAPALRLVAVLAGVLSHASVVVLAYGYVIGALIGILIYGRVLWRLCRDAGLFTPIVRVAIPAKEVLAFTFPMLVADVALAVMYGSGALALGYFNDMRSVAVFAAAVPLAVLNQTVMRCFALLYTSATSKLFAKGDLEGINALYWQTAVWLAVLTFPVFAVTFSAAGALTQFLYGAQYAAAGPILAMLALGEYVNVALGFNGVTLRVLNRSGYLTAISIGTALLTVPLVFWVAPRYGAWGVAAATSGSMVMHNVFKQLGLRLATGVTLFDTRYAGFYLALAGCAAGLLAANWLLPASPITVLVLTAIASASVLFFSRGVLKVADVFPEIRRVPFLRALLA